MEYLKIKYQNSCDLGGSLFSSAPNAFFYTIYLPMDIGRGSYELKEEGRETGEGTFVRDFGRLQRDYIFDIVIPEYTYDCLCHIQLHDLIFVTTKYDENSRVHNFKVGSPEWLDGGACKVQVSFTVDYVVNSGCCNTGPLTYQACVTCNSRIEVQDWISTTNIIFVNPETIVVKDKYYYLVGTLSGTELINNHLYYFDYEQKEEAVQGKWVPYIGRQYEAICWTDGGVTYRFYYDGHYWQPYQLIRDITDNGATVNVRGFCLPNTWVQLQISTDGVNYSNTGGVTAGSIFQSAGINISALTPGLTYYFRFRMYNNNCNYGYSNVETIVKT